MYKMIFALVASLGLVGCATPTNPEKLPDTSLSATSGVVLLSAGAEKGCLFGPAANLKVLSAGQSYGSKASHMMMVDNALKSSDFSTFRGNVHAIALPPGKYYVAPWFGGQIPIRITRFDFEVRANEVTYLGRYFMSMNCARSTRGDFSDQAEQDLELIRSKKPTLNLSSVRKQILLPTGFAY